MCRFGGRTFVQITSRVLNIKKRIERAKLKRDDKSAVD